MKVTELDIAGRVIGCAMAVHRCLGPGFLESVYHRALELELADAGISFESGVNLVVLYKSKPVGRFEADLVIERNLIVELKAVEKLVTLHEVQVVNYLTASGIEDGLLLNFGDRSLEFKRKRRTLPGDKGAPFLQR